MVFMIFFCIVGAVFGLVGIGNIISIFNCPEDIGAELAFAAFFFLVSALFFVLAFGLN